MIGCVVYPAAEVVEPGVVELVEGDRFSLGEPSGERTRAGRARCPQALIAAGFKAPVRPSIRDEIWVKLWGNLSFNPISALTHATLDAICADPGTRAVARAMMVEAQAIAEKLGVRFAIAVDKRIDGAAAVGAHKTSMLQDLERGRPMEIDALVDGGAGDGPAGRGADAHDRHGAGAGPPAGAGGGLLPVARMRLALGRRPVRTVRPLRSAGQSGRSGATLAGT